MKNKIIGIGNAIVDVVCKIDEKFLEENLLIKGSMSLIDDTMAQKLSDISAEKISSGGSVANSMAAIAQLKNSAAFVGKVALDDFGRKFISEIEKTGINFVAKRFADNVSAKSFILVTPDAQRTMCTFLGCASEIAEEDINEEVFVDASILYLEGYLWDREDTILALKKAISLAKKNNVKIAFTLSDLFCVARHKADFIDLITNDLDILFANESEIKELLDLENIENLQKIKDFFALNQKLLACITRSEKGCIILSQQNHIEVAAEKITKLVDTTGAGDCFAAGFLFGVNNGFTLEKSGHLGNLLASKIIQKFGARFDESEIKDLL
ncbi:MAG: adenosine kinase [Rickettsiales bacterium]|nr:adenosine kinase [Rickettsiales bacterium]